jgi:hypothetical protein
MKLTPSNELAFRTVKIMDIGYITTIYFVAAFFISTWIDRRVLGPFKPEVADRKTTLRLFLECLAHIYVVGVVIYIMRNIVEKIPSPWNGVAGLDHLRVKELTNAAVFTFIFLFYQKHLRDKLFYLSDRIYGPVVVKGDK